MLINDNLFREIAISGVPNINPLSPEYKQFWAEQRRRCIYGYTVGGKWMPGKLYWYINFWNIERQFSKNGRKQKGLPELREIEWDVFNIIEKCKGHTGFDQYGIPLYDGDIKGLLVISGRRTGKSYIGISCVGHEYTFYKNNEIVVSASIETYTKSFMNQLRLGLDSLPGGVSIAGEDYPPPFSLSRIKDDWTKEIRSGIKVIKDGVATTKGHNSRIIPITYGHNPMAANGKAPSFHVFEEIGSFYNLKECYAASQPCWTNENYQFGMPYLIGTGGDMTKGTVDANDMFHNPEAYNLMGFNSEWYESPTCYFIPAWRKLTEFKNEDGSINKIRATEEILKQRENKKRDQEAYEKELQYNPLTPKEAFLQSSGNIFPKEILQDQLEEVLSSKYTKHIGQKGILKWDGLGGLRWEPRDDVYEVEYPHQRSKKNDGCIVIYEHPDIDLNTDYAPSNVYIAGCDPYNKDQSSDSESLGSFIIFKQFYSVSKTFNIVVAEYTGRPDTTDEFFENCRKLCYYYNATVLHETQSSGDLMKAYFERKKCLNFLTKTPNILYSVVPNSKVRLSYGIPMPMQVKSAIINIINDHLNEETETGIYGNVKGIFSINLLKELIAYTNSGNFDRVMAFGLCLLYHRDMTKNEAQSIQDQSLRNDPIKYYLEQKRKRNRSYY